MAALPGDDELAQQFSCGPDQLSDDWKTNATVEDVFDFIDANGNGYITPYEAYHHFSCAVEWGHIS